MLPQDLRALVESHIKRSEQGSMLRLETSIDPIITEELCEDGGVVVDYCIVQCGEVVAVLNIQINLRMVHQRNHHIQIAVVCDMVLVAACCVHQCCQPEIVACIHIVDHAENSVEERETAGFLCSPVKCIHPASIDFIGVGLAVQQCLCRLFVPHIECPL